MLEKVFERNKDRENECGRNIDRNQEGKMGGMGKDLERTK